MKVYHDEPDSLGLSEITSCINLIFCDLSVEVVNREETLFLSITENGRFLTNSLNIRENSPIVVLAYLIRDILEEKRL